MGIQIISLNTHSKLVIKLVCEQRVGQLSEISFTQRADTVDVLQVDILVQIWRPVTLKVSPGWVHRSASTHHAAQFRHAGLVQGNKVDSTVYLSFWMLDETPDNLQIPSTIPCVSTKSLQHRSTWGTVQDLDYSRKQHHSQA